MHLYVIRTDIWDNFSLDSAFAYCSKGTNRIKTIDVLIVQICLQQGEALLKVKALPSAKDKLNSC